METEASPEVSKIQTSLGIVNIIDSWESSSIDCSDPEKKNKNKT